MADTSMAYVATKDCGCVVMVAMDMPNAKRENAKEIAACIRAGYNVTRMTLDEARERPWGKKCPHEQASLL